MCSITKCRGIKCETTFCNSVMCIVVLEESPCRRGSSFLNDQFTSPCPCPWTTKSSKNVEDFTFCKQSVMYHVKSINFVTTSVHEVTKKNGLLTDILNDEDCDC